MQMNELEKDLQAQLNDAESRRKGLEKLREEASAAREHAAAARAAEMAAREEANLCSREQKDLEVSWNLNLFGI